jgi:hypothetical protein
MVKLDATTYLISIGLTECRDAIVIGFWTRYERFTMGNHLG